MKKPYSKPDILFESFTLSTNIAAGCEAQPDTDKEGCGIRYSARQIIFATDEVGNNCNRMPDDTPYDKFCYHIFDEAFNIFMS